MCDWSDIGLGAPQALLGHLCHAGKHFGRNLHFVAVQWQWGENAAGGE